MSNIIESPLCSPCLNVTTATATYRVKACYDGIGKVRNLINLVDGADLMASTDADLIASIEAFVKGEALPAGATVEKRASCELSKRHVEREFCFSDGTDLIGKGIATLEKDAESGVFLGVVEFVASISEDAGIVVDEVYTALAGDVVLTSGAFETGDLVLEINGVTIEQAPCIECTNC